jgi:hypothetical protein
MSKSEIRKNPESRTFQTTCAPLRFFPNFFCIRYSFGFRILSFGFLACAALFFFPSVTFAAAPWWNNDWKHRVAITAPREARHSVLFELDAPQAKEDGSDIRVLNAGQSAPVIWRVVHRVEKKFTLEIALPDFATVAPNELPLRFFIYYGNPDAEKVQSEGWELPSVSAETLLLAAGQQPETWQDALFLLERTRREGERQFVPRISPEVIVFERSRPQLTVYRATIRCAEEGEYRFSLDSTGASFLVINDKLVVANSGTPRWGQLKASDAVQLAAGLHRVELYHVCLVPAAPVRLGWETPQMRRQRPPNAPADFRAIPAESLLPAARARQTSQETRGAPLNPFFTYSQRGAVRVNDVPEPFITVQFSDATVATTRIVARHWDFGDGRTSTANNPLMVFAGAKPRKVTYTVTDAKGDQVSVTRELEFEKTTPVPAQVVMEVERLPAVVASDAPLNFSVTVKNLRRREMELTLASTPMRFEPPTQPSPEEFQFKETMLKLGADDDFKMEIKCPPPRSKRTRETSLVGFSLVLKFHSVDVARAFIRFVRPDDSLQSLESDGHLMIENGERAVLVTDANEHRAEAPPGFPGRIVCFDDTLCGNGVVMDGGDSFAQLLEAALKIPVRHLPLNTEARASKGVPALYKFTQLDGAPIERGELVIVSLGLPDLKDRVSAADYEKQVMFIADYLRISKGANVLLVTPPPLPAEPEASRAYAKKVVQIGLQKNLPVLDLYSLMSARPSWRDFYRDDGGEMREMTSGNYLYYPNGTGQKWIAEEMARLISKWKR